MGTEVEVELPAGQERVRLRRLDPERVSDVELDELAALVNRCYRSTDSWTHEAQLIAGLRVTRERLRMYMDDRDVVLFVGELGGRIVASVKTGAVRDTVIGPLPPERAPAGYIGLLSVEPVLQSRGLGRALVLFAEQFCRQQLGLHRMALDVLEPRADIIAWYTRLGYQLGTARRPARKFMMDKGEQLVTEHDFDFVLMEKALA
ncbi:hypothetical protein FVE85_5296 [Porphyridium purpureum]|uniref:N-acetyltransferase domain-containing protein n=1 Tax=Porphyridium purpureum TaxID=35688 RepID=A0A5J4Z1J7_PORPP|nr:hypothetical protein FVE85_5296 [Porphyridium purpureum]|eukprot:POR6910..scf295_1